VHDYYRIADVWDGSRRALHAQVRAPWWRTLPESSARLGGRLSGRARVLDPEVSEAPAWRDEVALDFPSLHAPAERMRRAFLAADEAAPSLRITVDLPRRQSPQARRVPVQIVLPVCCGRCGGRGEVWGDVCAACDGRGLRDQPRYVLLRVPADVGDDTRLRYRLEGTHTPTLMIDARVRVR
jgi:hypothetical protein